MRWGTAGLRAIVGLSDEDLHRLSHQPLRYLDHDHLVPEASHGRDAALLNLLRTKVRETETVAAQVFITRSFEVLRPDILQALNRLSSTVYVMMILSVTKQPLTVKQIQQRLGNAMIIERCRELALRAPARVVFGCVRPTCAESRAIFTSTRSGNAHSGRQSV